MLESGEADENKNIFDSKNWAGEMGERREKEMPVEKLQKKIIEIKSC